MAEKTIVTFYPKNRQEWREWLQRNHAIEQSIWLVYYKKNSAKPTISYTEAVDEALCFGWIDSKINPVDEEKYIQFFSRRKAKSVWFKINKEKVAKLIQQQLMSKAGYEIIELAKQNGSWIILDDVEALLIPPDLEEKFASNAIAKEYFFSLSRSDKRNILQWLTLAKRATTRENRLKEIVTLAAGKRKPKQFT